LKKEKKKFEFEKLDIP